MHGHTKVRLCRMLIICCWSTSAPCRSTPPQEKKNIIKNIILILRKTSSLINCNCYWKRSKHAFPYFGSLSFLVCQWTHLWCILELKVRFFVMAWTIILSLYDWLQVSNQMVIMYMCVSRRTFNLWCVPTSMTCYFNVLYRSWFWTTIRDTHNVPR
jgi:hypothetical protein